MNQLEPNTQITPETVTEKQAMISRKLVTLELKVMNHPGVMMHIVSLFARRAFNLEGIACLPSRNGIHSRMCLRVFEDEQLEQIQRQLEKLVDVVEVHTHSASHEMFQRMETFFQDS